MKAVFFSLICLFGINSFSQYLPENIGKYYHYRERFKKHFIAIGEGPGKSIPFARIIQIDEQNKGKQLGLYGGEHTFQLGTYIGFLGTEYLLFKKSGLDFSETLAELFYALKAFNRLDYFAESYNSYGKAPSLNGFFVREDIQRGFSARNLPLFQDTTLHQRATKGYVQGKGTVASVDKVMGEESEKCLAHIPMSQDHAIRILWGLYLAHACLEEGLSFHDQEFRDGEKDLKTECRKIFNRLVTSFQNNGWIIRDPLGKEVENCHSKTGKIITFRNNILNAYHELNKKKSLNLHFPVMARAVAGVGKQNGWMNTRMWLESQNLSGEKAEVWKFATKYGFENYFVNYGILVHQWPFSQERLESLKRKTEHDLNSAPCEGPFYHNEQDYAKFGWACTDRTERGIRFQYLGIGHVRGNFNGLDYLLLHNLYYLNHFESLKPFPVKRTDYLCTEDCSGINSEILQKELQKVLKRLPAHKRKDIRVQNKVREQLGFCE